MFRHFRSTVLGARSSNSRRIAGAQCYTFRPRLESLEDRRLLTTAGDMLMPVVNETLVVATGETLTPPTSTDAIDADKSSAPATHSGEAIINAEATPDTRYVWDPASEQFVPEQRDVWDLPVKDYIPIAGVNGPANPALANPILPLPPLPPLTLTWPTQGIAVSPVGPSSDGPAFNNFGGSITIVDVAGDAVEAGKTVVELVPLTGVDKIVTAADDPVLFGNYPGAESIRTIDGKVVEVRRPGGGWVDLGTYRAAIESHIDDLVRYKRQYGTYPLVYERALVPEVERRLAAEFEHRVTVEVNRQRNIDRAGIDGDATEIVRRDGDLDRRIAEEVDRRLALDRAGLDGPATEIDDGMPRSGVIDDAGSVVDDAAQPLTRATDAGADGLGAGSRLAALGDLAKQTGAIAGKAAPFVEIGVGLFFYGDNQEFAARQWGSTGGHIYAVAQSIPVANDVSDIVMAGSIVATTDWSQVTPYEFSEAVRTEFLPNKLVNWLAGIEKPVHVDVPKTQPGASYWNSNDGKRDYHMLDYFQTLGLGVEATAYWRSSGGNGPDWQEFAKKHGVVLGVSR